MCGRFTLTLESTAIQNELQIGELPQDYRPRFNIAPSQPVAVVTDAANRNVAWFRWGFIPGWAKNAEIGNRMINARAETLAEKPTFKAALFQRRCLILADGFYEWDQSGQGSKKTPYWFHLTSHKPFAFAGLWDVWNSPEGKNIFSCTIITTSANAQVGKTHNRMPVILEHDRLWQWLAPQASPHEIFTLLTPYPDDQMTFYPVSPWVNHPGNDTPLCIEPAPA